MPKIMLASGGRPNARHTPIRAVSVTVITMDKVGKATAYLLTAISTVVGTMA